MAEAMATLKSQLGEEDGAAGKSVKKSKKDKKKREDSDEEMVSFVLQPSFVASSMMAMIRFRSPPAGCCAWKWLLERRGTVAHVACCLADCRASSSRLALVLVTADAASLAMRHYVGFLRCLRWSNWSCHCYAVPAFT